MRSLRSIDSPRRHKLPDANLDLELEPHFLKPSKTEAHLNTDNHLTLESY